MAWPAIAAPQSEPWVRWAVHDPQSTQRIDHSPWDAFLARYLRQGADAIHRIAYGKIDAVGRDALAQYVDGLASVRVSGLGRDEQRAFWINLYNSLTVKVVRDHYPVASIRDIDISPGLFSNGPWGRKLIVVESEPVSLDDIEHRILRPLWQDARLHYALNCASLGCPNLPAVAFTADNTEALLEQGARDYVNHSRGAVVAQGRLTVSSIYIWFQADFGGTDAGVLEHLRRFAEPVLRQELAGVEAIAGHAYDWRLNDAP